MQKSYLEQARAAFQQGEPSQVVQLLDVEAGFVQHPEDRDTLALLGMAYHDLGRAYEASDTLERASLLGPICDEARIALASSYAQLRRLDLARELYLQLALSRRLSPELMLQVAAGLAAIDAPQLAMKVCEWITEIDDSVAQAYYDMGVYSATSGNALYLTEALTRRALQLDAANVHYRIGLVALLIQLHREDEALAAFGNTSLEQIHTVRCHTCLQRIESILRCKQRFQEADACRARIDELTSPRDQTSLDSRGGVIQ